LQQPVFEMLHGHTSSSCILSTLVILCSLLPGLQAAEMAMVLLQHHHMRMTNFIAVWDDKTFY